MKNIPEKIYLQVGDECPDDVDFKELHEVTWCKDKVFNNDIEFVLNKHDVIGWQEFEKQMPNAGDEIIIISPVTNEKSIVKFRVRPKDELFWKGWKWHIMPACL